MKKEYSVDELLHKAASYCSISEHCTSEVEEKLNGWGVSDSNKQEIISKLISEDFINEKKSDKVVSFIIEHRASKEQDEMSAKFIDEVLGSL